MTPPSHPIPDFDQAIEQSAPVLDAAATQVLEDPEVLAALENPDCDDAW